MDLMKNMENMTGMLMKKKFWSICCTVAFALMLALSLSGCTPGIGGGDEELSDVPEQGTEIPMDESDASGEDGASNSIDIPQDADTDKMVSVAVDNLGRTNPFLPPGETAYSGQTNVPKERLKYDVLPPLESPAPDYGAKKVVSTKVSGIMYDKSSPSAILNIDGLDYLVRSGDVINGYKVLSIDRSTITVQFGSNVYKAGVGQLVAGQGGVNYNQVANLSNKFGGRK